MQRALVRLCVCAFVLGCTDPRPRIAPPTVRILVASTLKVTSPGNIPASIYAYDAQGLDQVDVSVLSGQPTLDGDSLYGFTSQNEQTLTILWGVPPNIPVGTRVTLAAKVRNVLGFIASDSVILTVQQ